MERGSSRARTIAAPVHGALSANELRVILAGHPAFTGLSDPALEAVARAAEREFVPAGSRLVAAGVIPDSAFVIEHGRLRATDARTGQHVGHDVVVEFGRGDICGLGLLVAQLPTGGAVIAMRDTMVLRLRREPLMRCMAAHPELVVAQARQLYELALRTHVKAVARPRIFTLMPVGAVPIDAVVRPFLGALSETLGAGSALDSRRVAEIFGESGRGGDDRLRHRVSEWCSNEEERGRLLLLVCDREINGWTRWCLQQTDRIFVAASATDAGAVDEVRRIFADCSTDGAAPAVDVLLLHESDVDVPHATRPWLELERRRRHLHVRIDRPADFRRAARRIGESAVAVVLGGGGARALAHIGVLQALEEAGVPVDVVGGTSMGAVVAAAYARGWSPERMRALFAEHVPDARALRDLAFPRRSLLAGRKLDRVLQFAFEDLDLADLWRPCFCVSADLAGGRMIVHDRGPLWQAVRASCSLPGVFPPVSTEGRLLVDGGVVNNVPIDVMEREHVGSTLIAVDVGSAGMGATEEGPGIVHVLTSSTMLGSKEQLQGLVEEGHADLFLQPPVQHIKLLGFDARESLVKIGYDHARASLADWRVGHGAARAIAR